MSSKPKMLLSGLIMLLSSACGAGTIDPVRPVSNYCLIAKGIGYASPVGTETAENKYDTPETVRAIEAHNLEYMAVCGD